jgi:hypothetical protein
MKSVDHSPTSLNGNLHALLGRMPWQETIMDVIGAEGIPPALSAALANSRLTTGSARALRRELDAAITVG